MSSKIGWGFLEVRDTEMGFVRMKTKPFCTVGKFLGILASIIFAAWILAILVQCSMPVLVADKVPPRPTLIEQIERLSHAK